jgi:2-keto-4-pentenoate hydratase/2-oxohepta-3-ene-1,7-dioic acid hydratase in catechol pathway
MNVKRIFCIGRNYAEHISELGNSPDSGCVVFMKPPSALVPSGEPLILPKNRGAVHHEAELVVLLTGGGRDIPAEEAMECVAGLTLGLDLTLRDVQTELKSKGLPWELAKAFDGSAPIGDWRPYLDQDLQKLEFSFSVNGTVRQQGRTSDMLYSVARQIEILSRTWSLEPGDALFTGTPKGVGPLLPGDRLELKGPGLGTHSWVCE